MKQKTVKVENKDLKSGFMLINECDFDEKVHVLFDKPKQDSKPNAGDVIKEIEACESLDDLKAYESDDRKTVKAAYEKRVKELSPPDEE